MNASGEHRLPTVGAACGGDLDTLVRELKAAGFAVQVHGETGAVAAAFKNLRQLRSFTESAPGPGALCYLEKLPADFDFSLWDFLIVDEKLAAGPITLNKIKKPALVSKHAAAVADFIARKVWSADWAGAHVAPKNLAKIILESGVLIGPDTTLGDGTVIEVGCRIGRGVKIGKNCRIGAHSRIGDFCEIGDNCELSSHVAIGGQGFGFVHYPNESRPRPRRHLGRVIVGDRVRLGAHVAIDRGVFEDTVVGDRTALDNIVQVAHNSQVGVDGVICSFVGLSGSTDVGDRVTIAGMVGTKGHMRIGNDVTVAAQSGVTKDVADGQVVKGYPPRPLAEALELQTLFLKLPEIYKRLKDVEKIAKKKPEES